MTHDPDKGPMVVGIGASAGGLKALRTFFDLVSEDSGLAYVVVVHLSPEHESHLADLLQPYVKMPVDQVTETVPLEANRVYVIPPGRNLTTIDTHLRLSPQEEKRRERAPVDHFLRTLAATHEGHAIGVILTGTGSDGALGIKEIKEKGGLTVVQAPSEAEYDGMPQAAVSTGLVDLVLPLAQIPEAVLRFARTDPNVPTLVDDEGEALELRRLLQKVLVHVRSRTGRDFSRYKRSTMLRRLGRRMQVRHIEEVGAYVDLLRREPSEAHALAEDLLVTVTHFFRDPDVFQKLEEEVIPKLFEGKGHDDDVRVWSVGCATGEEAYSLAMLLLEQAARHEERHGPPPRLQVFASDLHERSLETAREGVYPGDIASDVGAERLRRFFHKENGGYRIRKEVRDLVVFAPHNLMGDPPFSRQDLIACRNVLIYLEREVQRDIVELFHYALRNEGFLVLGTSETVDSAELFRVVDKKLCLFQRSDVLPAQEPRLPVFPRTRREPSASAAEPLRSVDRASERAPGSALYQRMVERYGPPSLLVSPDDRVVQLSARASRYLAQPGGESTLNVFKYVRSELQLELRAALRAARSEGRVTTSQPVIVPVHGSDGSKRAVVVEVHPALEPSLEGYVFVLFEEREPTFGQHRATTDAEASDERTRVLEAELERTKKRMQAILEEYESSQEEMRASNEELQSANEELRSTMEELETSKEELQSMNEELQTVNQENRHKVEELSQLSSDLQNLMAATEIATLFLDRDLTILRFTPKVGELFNVRVTDRGRPLADLTHRLGYSELIADAESVLERRKPIHREVEGESGRWYLTRVLPYRGSLDRIEGVVITFVDITERKRHEQALAEAKTYAESIVETLHEPLLILTPDLRVRSANDAFYEHFQVTREATEGELIYRLGNDQWDIPALRTLLEDVLADSNVFNDFEVTHDFEFIGERTMLVNARRLDSVQLILLGIRDITERKQAVDALRASEERLQKMINIEGVGVLAFDEHGSLVGANDTFLQMHGYTREEAESGTMTWRDLTPEPYVAESERQIEKLEETGRIGPYEKEYLRKDGSRSWMLFVGADLGDGTIVEYCIDISDRKQAEKELRILTESLEARVRERTDEVQALASRVLLAEQRERERIAQLLHDDVQQTLHALTIRIKNVASKHGIDRDEPELKEALSHVQATIEATRSLAAMINPPVLQHGSLADALQWLAEHMHDWHRLQVDTNLELEGLEEIEDLRKILVFHSVRELLFNVVKHAEVRSARLTAGFDGKDVVIELEDEGAGFDVAEVLARESPGFGLVTLRERLRLHRGNLEIDAAPSQGTRMRLRIPIVAA